MAVLVKRLAPMHRGAVLQHFLLLGPEDRHLRFGGMISDQGIADYVAGIDFDRGEVFGVFDDDLGLVGACHVALSEGMAELGVSVLSGNRGRGIGSALFDRAGTFARNQRVEVLFMHCLTENSAMMHIARKSKMRIVAASGEADAHLQLLPGDSASITRELLQEQIALFDYALRSQVLSARRIRDAAFAKPQDRD
jgi:GNAT superfamily N-acetyltransferase